MSRFRAYLDILTVTIAFIACAGSDAGTDTTDLASVDLSGDWVLRDSSNIVDSLAQVYSNTCIMRMPLRFDPGAPTDTLWVAWQDTGSTLACELNGVSNPPTPLPYFDRQFIVTRRGDSVFFADAGGSTKRIYLGKLRDGTLMSGRRDAGYDGRHGIWRVRR